MYRQKPAALVAAVRLGAFLIDTQVSHHLPNVSYQNIVELREIRKRTVVPFYDISVSRSANLEALGAVLKHTQNVGMGNRNGHPDLCGSW
jgi:hypothetical protein